MSAMLESDFRDVVLNDDERQRCEIWTRVMGYHRPVASFNIGKQGEHEDRLSFVVCARRSRIET